MLTYIKKMIPKALKNKIKMFIGYWENKQYYRESEGEKRIFIIGVPSHGNLGDQAIIYAEREFLNNYLGEYKIVELDTLDVLKHIKAIKRYLNKDDIVMLHGGGNFGVEYLIEEEVRREVVAHIKSNPLIFFPQTMDFGESEKGKIELEKTKKIYSNNPNLVLVAREKVSYEMMKKHFLHNKILLTPDIVLSINKQSLNTIRSGVIVCMRADCESILSDAAKKSIEEVYKQKFEQVKITDTVVNRRVLIEDRNKELENKWNEFRQAELVITDRLHGMVFAAITGTPCIVMSNYNHKVKGTYEWIQHLDYIKFVNSIEELESAINTFKSGVNDYKYDETVIVDKYQVLKNCLKEKGV